MLTRLASSAAGAVILLVEAMLQSGSLFAALAAAPQVRIVSPEPMRVAVGLTPILVEVDPAGGRTIAAVRIYADGVLVATLSAPPWQAVFDAGEAIRGHSLRVEAVDDQGVEGRAFGATLYLPFVDEVEVRGDIWSPGTVAINVLSAEDQPLKDVAAAEFAATLSSRSAKVGSVALDSRPLVVSLLLDVSGDSVPYFGVIRRAAEGFISTMQPEDSQEVLLFAGRTYTLSPYGRDHVQARRAILTENFNAPINRTGSLETRLYDALVTAIESVNPRAGQRSILVLTDALDTDSLTSFEEIREVVRHAGIRIDVIRYGRTPVTGWTEARRRIGQFESLPDETGGMLLKVRRPEDLTPAINQLARMLRARYRVQLEPAGPLAPGWRRLAVDIKRKGSRVLAPAGIFFPAPLDQGAKAAVRPKESAVTGSADAGRRN